MRTALLTAHTPNIESWAKRTVKNKELYCQAHNIELIVSDNPADFPVDRHPAWRKVRMILENIEKYDRLIWIDADAVFMNYVEAPDRFFVSHISVAQDTVDINSGVMFIKSSFWCGMFFDHVWRFYPEWRHKNPWDQQAIIEEHGKQGEESGLVIIPDHINKPYWNLCLNDNVPYPLIIHPWGFHETGRKEEAINKLLKNMKL